MAGTAGAGRTAHEAADTVKQEGREAKGTLKQAGEALEEGFVAAVQAPRHLAETVKHQVVLPLLFLFLLAMPGVICSDIHAACS